MRRIALATLIAAAPLFGNPEMTVDLPGGATMDFVWIEPGTFMMGSPESEEGADGSEWPQHKVMISRGFWLGKHEITQAQWDSVRGPMPWSLLRGARENPDCAAVGISWSLAQNFIQRLNIAAGDSLYRLPTEAEWEYACRAGTTTRWSFGDDESQLGDHAWGYYNAWGVAEKYAHAVGTKLPNPWGLYDMHGNGWEWCQDWYGPYPSDSQIDPFTAPVPVQMAPFTPMAPIPVHVMRGGDIYSTPRRMRSACRTYDTNNPGSSADQPCITGARLVRMADAPPTSVTPESWGKVKATRRAQLESRE